MDAHDRRQGSSGYLRPVKIHLQSSIPIFRIGQVELGMQTIQNGRRVLRSSVGLFVFRPSEKAKKRQKKWEKKNESFHLSKGAGVK
jgi:hypothetical protein